MLLQIIIFIRSNFNILQAAWIVDDTDEEDLDSDEEADGMVVDEMESGFPGEDGSKNSELIDDQVSLSSRDTDEETDVDSVMMVSFESYNSKLYIFYVIVYDG